MHELMGDLTRAADRSTSHLVARLQSFPTDSARERFLQGQGLLAASAMLREIGISVPDRKGNESGHLIDPAATEGNLLARLKESGVDASLAGASLAAWTLYLDSAQRERTDVLILMPMASCRLAWPILSDMGFRPVRAQSKVTREEVWHRSDSEVPMRVVLRWGVCDHPLLARRFSISGALAHSRELEGPVAGVRGLDRIYSVLYMALRYFDARSFKTRLIDLLDQDLAWRALSEDDCRELLQLARQRGVAGLLEAHLRMVRAVFDTPVPDEMLTSLAQSARQEHTSRLIRARNSGFRYHWLAARTAQGFRPRWRHLLAAFKG